ncbi:MAG: zinc ribbon domain-containing protein [Candidatus Omnitrophica bacterium]|nr:zinc ribbon domain-containing protein [Candidatus Omnitrophota bacterium]
MPIHTYLCKKCLKKSDFLSGVNQDKDAQKLKCPHCGSKDLEKTLAAFSIAGSSKCSSCSGGDCSSCS